MPLILEPYSAQDVYNQDETGLFWRQLPNRRLATGKKAGRKKERVRVTVSATCNASGTDKLGSILIGQAMKPRSLPKGLNPETRMNRRYRSNKSAWMTTKCWSDWVTDWNRKSAPCVLYSNCVCSTLVARMVADVYCVYSKVARLC